MEGTIIYNLVSYPENLTIDYINTFNLIDILTNSEFSYLKKNGNILLTQKTSLQDMIEVEIDYGIEKIEKFSQFFLISFFIVLILFTIIFWIIYWFIRKKD